MVAGNCTAAQGKKKKSCNTFSKLLNIYEVAEKQSPQQHFEGNMSQ